MLTPTSARTTSEWVLDGETIVQAARPIPAAVAVALTAEVRIGTKPAARRGAGSVAVTIEIASSWLASSTARIVQWRNFCVGLIRSAFRVKRNGGKHTSMPFSL